MTTYDTAFVTDVTQSSAYTGRPASANGNVVNILATSDGAVEQDVYKDGDIAPNDPQNGTIPPERLTSYIPRFGKNVASNKYNPPFLTLVPFGNMLPQYPPSDFRQWSSNTFLYTYDSSPVATNDSLWALTQGSIRDALKSTAPDYLDQFDTLINAYISQKKNYTLPAFTPNPPSGSVIKDGMFLFIDRIMPDAGDKVIGSDTGDTFVASISSVDVSSVTAGAGRLTIVYAYDGITIDQSLGDPAGVVIIVTEGTLTIAGSPDDLLTVETSASKFLSWENSALAYSGNSYPIAPVTQNPDGGMVQKITIFDDWYTGSSHYFNMVPNTGIDDLNWDALAEAIGFQYAYQFGLSLDFVYPQISARGVIHIWTVVDQQYRESIFVIQDSADTLPNVYVATEPFDDDEYIYPMIQSYRISDGKFAIFKSGRYITFDQKSGDIVISSTDLALIQSYTMADNSDDTNTILVDKICSVSINDPFPTGSPTIGSNNEGGMDPYTLDGDTWRSRYRRLLPQVSQVAGSKIVIISAPYDDHVRYSPFNGRVISDPSGILTIRNPGRRASMVSMNCTVRSSRVPEATLSVKMNTAHDFSSSSPVVVFADPMHAHIVSNEKLYILKAGAGPITIDGFYTFTYSIISTSSTVTGRIKKDQDATWWEQQLVPVNDPQITTENVYVIVIFGDMVEQELGYIQQTDETFEYLFRSQNGIVANCLLPRIVYGNENVVNTIYHTQAEVDALIEAGFIQDAFDEAEYWPARRALPECTRSTVYDGNQTLLMDIWARKLVQFVSGADRAYIGVGPLIFNSADVPSKSITFASDGTVSTSSFPFSLSHTTYVASPQPGQGATYPRNTSEVELDLKTSSAQVEIIWAHPSVASLITTVQDTNNRCIFNGFSSPPPAGSKILYRVNGVDTGAVFQ